MDILSSVTDNLSLEQFEALCAHLDELKTRLMPAHVEVICDSRAQTQKICSVFARGHVPESVVLWVDPVWWNEEAPGALAAVTFRRLELLPLRMADIAHKPGKPTAQSFRSGFYSRGTVEGNVLCVNNPGRHPRALPVVNPLHPADVFTVGPFVDYGNVRSEFIHVSDGMLGQHDLGVLLKKRRIAILDTDVLADDPIDVDCEEITVSPNVLGVVNRIKCDVLTLVLDQDLADLRRMAETKTYAQVWELRLQGKIRDDQQAEMLSLLDTIFGIRTRIDSNKLRFIRIVTVVNDE